LNVIVSFPAVYAPLFNQLPAILKFLLLTLESVPLMVTLLKLIVPGPDPNAAVVPEKVILALPPLKIPDVPGTLNVPRTEKSCTPALTVIGPETLTFPNVEAPDPDSVWEVV
jgi:hypothetical protein